MRINLLGGLLTLSLLVLITTFRFALLQTDSSNYQPSINDNSVWKTEALVHQFNHLPLTFEPNYGQTDSKVKFLSRGKGYTIFLTEDEAVVALKKSEQQDQSAVLRIRPEGASSAGEISGQNLLAGKSNYFIGVKTDKWLRDVPTFGRVQYKDVYAGIDQVFYGNGRQLEYDFIVSPNADPRQIALKFDGADRMSIADNGDLVFKFGETEMRQQKPFVYQETGGVRREIAAKYSLRNGKVGFALGEYDRSKPLVIDPVLVYSTYLGGNEADVGYGIAVDDERNVYVTGGTSSPNFPIVNPVQANLNARGDVFVTKINAAGNAIVYSTYIGGSVGDGGRGIDVDNSGNAYVTGTTGASISFNDFPVVNAFDSTYNGTDDAFLLKLSPTGNALVYSTYLGGNNTDIGTEVKVNRATGEAFVAGNSLSQAGFPTTPGAFNVTCSNCISGSFVTKFNAPGNALVFSTYIGPGPANDLAIDTAGNAYIAGSTTSNAFPITPGALQPTCTGCNLGRSDAFITKLNATGTALVYSTYLGGSIDEVASSIAVDAAGNAYVTGRTESGSGASVRFPTSPGAYQTVSLGTPDAFVTKINPSGTAFVYSTYFGGDVRDEAFGIAVDPAGNAHLTGETRSRNFPLVEPFQSICTVNGGCAFISTLNSEGSASAFSTFFGQGRGIEIAADNTGAIYVTGEAIQGLSNLPTMNPIQPNHGAGNSVFDGFVAKIQVQTNQARKIRFDFDGDGKADISVFRPSNGAWYRTNSSNGSFFGTNFGQQGDLITPADFDGDGRADIGVFRNGYWYRFNSANNEFVAEQFGTQGDIPMPGDYDGDGRADISVWRSSSGNWFRLNSSNGEFIAVQFGALGDKPQIADIDGDGKSDPTVYRPSNGIWYSLRSSNNTLFGINCGISTDIPTAADYDGDGRTDVSVFRPSNGTWYRFNSSDNQFVALQFGANGDIPTAADYDGDGKTDFSVFRPSNGVWYQQRSTAGFFSQQFGANGDIPIPSAFGQ